MRVKRHQKVRQKWGNCLVREVINGQDCRFRSKLECRWGRYLQFLKEQGEILDWWYEKPASKIELKTGNKKRPILEYLPDFLVRGVDDMYEYHETKGYLSAKDVRKFKLMAEQCAWPVILVMTRRDKRNAKREGFARKYVKRIIYASDIFKQIKGVVDLEC